MTVTITGRNFGVNPRVEIDGFGVSRNILSSSSTEIRAVFSVADFAYEGTRDVRVISLGQSGTGFVPGAPEDSDRSNSVGFEVSAKIKYEISDVISIMVGESKSVHVKITGSKGKATSLSLGTTGSNTPKARFANGATSINITGDIDTNYTIIGVAGSSQSNDTYISLLQNPFGPGSNASLLKRFTVIGVIFEQESACSGFDNIETPNPYLMVPQNGTNKFKATVVPSGASGNFRLAGLEQNGVSASPTTITSGEQTITVTAGNNVGTFTLQALGTNAAEPAAVLKIAVRKRINKTVVIHAISEENDDEQAIAVGTTTGGRPTTACVTAGNNGFLDSVPNINDEVITGTGSAQYISVGANRICETAAKNTNTPADPANIPSATALETALNGTYWGKQANVYFTVTRGQDYAVNYDLDLDGKINSEQPGDEPIAIENKAIDTSKDYNLYYMGLGIRDVVSNGTTKHPLAFGDPRNLANTFFGPPGVGNGTIIYLASHEIGHLLEKTFEHSSLVEDLMYGEASNTNPCRIRKRDWDLANPDRQP